MSFGAGNFSIKKSVSQARGIESRLKKMETKASRSVSVSSISRNEEASVHLEKCYCQKYLGMFFD